jgi:hypothetical protein
MNLFYHPSLSDLAELFTRREKPTGNFNIIVDYDGEVLIEKEGKIPEDTLRRFKFYIKDLHASLHSGFRSARKLKLLNDIYKSIMFCWEQDISGPIRPDTINRIQEYKYQIEQSEIRKKAYPTRIRGAMLQFRN